MHAMQDLSQSLARKRFFHNRVGADVVSITRAGDHDDAKVFRLVGLTQRLDERATVHPWQLEVDERGLHAGLSLRDRECSLAVICVEHAISVDLEDVAQQIGGRGLVLDSED